MTSSCRDSARRFLNAPDGDLGADTSLLLWECVVGMCPDGPYLLDALDWIAGFFDYHGQPKQAAKYREVRARLQISYNQEVCQQ